VQPRIPEILLTSAYGAWIWTDFSAEEEVVVIPPRIKGKIAVEIAY
jgi:hypothetical protein